MLGSQLDSSSYSYCNQLSLDKYYINYLQQAAAQSFPDHHQLQINPPAYGTYDDSIPIQHSLDHPPNYQRHLPKYYYSPPPSSTSTGGYFQSQQQSNPPLITQLFTIQHHLQLQGEIYNHPQCCSSNNIISTESMNRACTRRYSPEEKKERIQRYRSKRNLRNFNIKIQYECRKTLAERRPRVRGRFARNDDRMEMTKLVPPDHIFIKAANRHGIINT